MRILEMSRPSCRSRARLRGILALALFVAWPTHAATVEEIFAAARNYTVFIETRIETPFIEDDPGSYLGAGFIVDRERGWVMTNAHVVGRSPATLNVTFADGSASAATPLYIDSFLDLAIVQLEGGVTRARSEASLDCAQRPDVGVPVGAYGHPNGYRFTGTRGIVSGFSMRAGSSGLQTDAPINAGNSGGPLIRLDTGNVVGVNTQSLVGNDMQNMNFAVETLYSCRVLELLREGRDPRPRTLDVLFYTEKNEPTLVVAHVSGRAADAGLRTGDEILAVDGVALEPADVAELTHRMRGVDGAVALRVRRTTSEEVTLSYPVSTDDAVMARRGFYLAGALFAPTHFQDAGLLVDQPALMVHFVAPGSPAEAAGLAPFDLLVGVNEEPIADVDQLARVTEESDADSADFEVIRLSFNASRFTRDLRASLPLDHAKWVALAPTKMGPAERALDGDVAPTALARVSVPVGIEEADAARVSKYSWHE